nr:hypothetical protein [Tanacetum cinerariifolium]
MIKTRPSPTMESTLGDDQNKNSSVPKTDPSPGTITSKPFIKFVKPNDSPSKSKTGKTETPKKPPVKKRVKKGTSRSQNNTHVSFTPRPVVHRPYRHPVKPMRTNMNGARPNKTSSNKQAHSYENRPFQRTSAVRSQIRAPWVPTANRNFPPVSRKLSTGKAVKALACWFWKPSQNLSKKGPNNNSVSVMFKKYTYIDTQGRLKTVAALGTWQATYPTSLIMSHLIEDMCLLVKEDARLLANKQSKPNSVLFTDSECIVLGREFKLLDDANILLRTPRQHNRRIGHLNFKTMNKLVRHNLVRGLPTKFFENDHTCTACLKGKQHKASCKSKLVNSVTKPLHTLHMDLFGSTSVSSISYKWYCLVATDDFSRDQKIVSNARTPQQNGIAERRNRTLIEAARTMLADAKLPVTFWAEAVNTACYVQNRVLVNKSHNKTPYELFNGRSPAIGFLKPFGCHVMILNTLDNLRKFEEKWDEGYFIGYSMSSKAFRVFNKRTRRVEENLHVEFLENKAIEKGAGPNWLFDIDSLTKSMNYVPVDAGTISTNLSGSKDATSQEVKKDVSSLRYITLPNWAHDALLKFSSSEPQDHCSTEVPEALETPIPLLLQQIPQLIKWRH